MFLEPGDEKMIANIREVCKYPQLSDIQDIHMLRRTSQCLDTGEEFPYPPDSQDSQVSLAFASSLLRFLDSLEDSIVPTSLHGRCVEMTNRDEAFEVRSIYNL